MIDFEQEKIERFAESLKHAFLENYGNDGLYAGVLAWAGRMALETIANSDMLYHDVDHTICVAQVGQEILKGKHLLEGGVTREHWLHYMVAVLCHDIGYVRGICRNDRPGVYDTGVDGKCVEISMDGSNALLTPYHVDRGKLYVRERFSNSPIGFDVDLIGYFIEQTRFTPSEKTDTNLRDYPALTKAADFIGQLGDPARQRKIPALYFEFEELGFNEKFGYHSPGDMRRDYPKFFWGQVHPYLGGAIEYLRATLDGKQFLANLYANVFEAQHELQNQAPPPRA